MELVQVYLKDGTPVALYELTNENLSEDEITALVNQANQIGAESDDESAEDFLSENGLERVFINHEIFVD